MQHSIHFCRPIRDPPGSLGAEIVHNDDIAGLEGRHQHLLDIGAEALAVDRPSIGEPQHGWEGLLKKPKQNESDGPAGKIGALTDVLVAVGALIAAAKPIYEFLAPFPCQVLPTSWCGAASSVAVGTTGWMYVGTRVNEKWQVTAEEGREPALTLQIGNLPIPGQVYDVIRSVNLRAELPKEQPDGNRPLMPDSIGPMGPGSQVKVLGGLGRH